MLHKWLSYGLLGLCALLCVALGVQTARADRWHSAFTSTAYAVDSLVAINDTTRSVMGAAVTELGDSLKAVTKRAVQTAQAKDAVDRELHQARAATAQVDVQIDSLRTYTTVAATEDSTSRHAVFDVSHLPYTVHADVSIPAPPDSATLNLYVKLAPAHLSVRIGCDERSNSAGVAAAQAVVIGPSWLEASLDSVSQDPRVCRSMTRTEPPNRLGRLERPVVSAGLWMAVGAVLWHLIR